MTKKKMKAKVTPKPASKYHLSIIGLLVASAILIVSIWYWFDMKTRELEERMHNEDKPRYEQVAKVTE
jgi:hypothetical protein